MSKIRTPAEMADQINSLNCHARGGGYGPVTPTQMEAIYKEARKMEWTDNKPDRVGWWAYRDSSGEIEPVKLHNSQKGLRAGGFVITQWTGQWSMRPIDMPEEKK